MQRWLWARVCRRRAGWSGDSGAPEGPLRANTASQHQGTSSEQQAQEERPRLRIRCVLWAVLPGGHGSGNVEREAARWFWHAGHLGLEIQLRELSGISVGLERAEDTKRIFPGRGRFWDYRKRLNLFNFEFPRLSADATTARL